MCFHVPKRENRVLPDCACQHVKEVPECGGVTPTHAAAVERLGESQDSRRGFQKVKCGTESILADVALTPRVLSTLEEEKKGRETFSPK